MPAIASTRHCTAPSLLTQHSLTACYIATLWVNKAASACMRLPVVSQVSHFDSALEPRLSRYLSHPMQERWHNQLDDSNTNLTATKTPIQKAPILPMSRTLCASLPVPSFTLFTTALAPAWSLMHYRQRVNPPSSGWHAAAQLSGQAWREYPSCLESTSTDTSVRNLPVFIIASAAACVPVVMPSHLRKIGAPQTGRLSRVPLALQKQGPV